MSNKQLLHIEEIMQSTQNEKSLQRSSNEHKPAAVNDGRTASLPYSVPINSLPPGVQHGLLIPPQIRRVSENDAARSRPWSNLTALLESSHSTLSPQPELVTPQQDVIDESKDSEADSASGPSRPSPPEIGSLARSAPSIAGPDVRGLPPPDRIPKHYASLRPLGCSIGKTEATKLGRPKEPQQVQLQPKSHVRRSISSNEFGTLGPPSGSPFSTMLYQREVLEATLQQRLVEARRSSMSRERSLNSSPAPLDSSDCSDSSKRGGQHELKNETRNRRRAEHTRAVTNDLCEIVTDLFVAEAKLLKPSNYGFDTSLQRHQVLKNVCDFVSTLPPRYALGVDTPSEVLLHMRLMAAARMDHSRVVVHVTNTKGNRGISSCSSVHLVTISCIDAIGLLEYITRILATGGSRVLDADVMLSTDNIVLVRSWRRPMCQYRHRSF